MGMQVIELRTAWSMVNSYWTMIDDRISKRASAEFIYSDPWIFIGSRGQKISGRVTLNVMGPELLSKV